MTATRVKQFPNVYYDEPGLKKLAGAGRHREIIGGLWDEIGQLQTEFLVGNGLKPESWFVDIGCGSLRAGVKLVPYLLPGHYHGIDISNALLEAGYEREIVPNGLGARLPRGNLLCNENFDISAFGRTFDFAMAQSVFSHLPIGELSNCLARIAPFFGAGARFFATYFECPEDWPDDQPMRHVPGDTITHAESDPFHYKRSWIGGRTRHPAWELEFIGGWKHPRGQKMLKFTRTVKQ